MSDVPETAITTAARSAYSAWQSARGVPETLPGHGWDLLPDESQRRWITVAEAVADAIARRTT